MKRIHLLLILLMSLALPMAMWGQTTLPYEYGFENNDLAAEGWTRNSLSSSTNISSNAKRTGNYGFRFNYNADPQYLITPELSTTSSGVTVEFYYKTSSTYFPRTFQVGYSTTTTDVSAFVFGDEITASDAEWVLSSQDFPAGTKYVAIKHENTSYGNLYLDDFNFEECSEYPAPKNLVLTAYTSSTATLDWTPRTGQDHWDIYYSTSNVAPDASTTPQVSNIETKPHTLTGLIPGETYYAYVRGNYNNGEHYSDWSNACSFEVGCFTPNVSYSQATCNQVYFSWTPVGAETSWQVAFSEQQGFDPDEVTPETVTIQYYVKHDLTTGVTYYARVRAVCGDEDYSDWSEEVSMTTECIAPSNLQESSVTPTTATLAWMQGSNESQWQISYSTTSGFTPESGTIETVNTRPYTLSGLTLDTQYYAYVRAVCGENIYSDWSDICAFMPRNELTVGNGTNYNAYIPICTSAIDYTTKSQFIVPAADLADLLYANISKMTFYATSDEGSMGTATFDILIGELDGVTAFENYEFFNWSEMTSVYSGSLSLSESKMEITLAAPYQYMGGDLLIGFTETASGSTSNYFGWYGAATTGYCAYGGYEMTAYGYTDYGRYQFMPKTTFSYTPGTAPTCLKPKNLVSSNVGATSATLSWINDGSESAWVIEYATDANFTQNAATVNVSTNPYTLTGLTPETTYYAHVKASCGDDDYSAWSNVCSFTPSAIQTIVVNNGTGTGYYVPFYGSNTNSANVKSQFIVPSSELADVVNQHITQLTFHTDTYYSSASFPDGVFKVYLAPTTMTEFASSTPVDWTTLTEVYSGSLSISNNQMDVILSVPYLYTGGNLLVAFDETTMSSAGAFISWLGVTTENYPALSYNTTYYYRRQFLPKMTVTYNTAMATCSVPTNLVVAASFNSATLTWTAGNEETDWNVQYKATSTSEWSEVIAVENTPICTINGLSEATEYDVRIQANCGSTASSWLTDSFTTECGAVSIPYSYDFSDITVGSNTAFPTCWTRINDSGNANYDYYPFVTGNSKLLKFVASATANAPVNQIAVMPEITADINTLRMSFKAYLNTGSEKTLSIGVMTDPNDASTFTKVVDVVVRNTNTSTFYPISLEGYQGNGHYIAFKCNKLSSGSDCYILIDNIEVETVPTVTPENIPYSYGFEDATTGYNAFPPDGWHFSGPYYPYVYEGTYPHSGTNFLLMQKQSYETACYAVLPAINTTVYPINTLQVTFWGRTWNHTDYGMTLTVGVMTDPNDISTFETVGSVSLNNTYKSYEVFIDNCTNNGQYIALRCYNTNNYICVDDIEVSLAPACIAPLELSSNATYAHEAYIRWKTRKADQLDYQVSYSTEAGFDPADGTIVDVHFDSPLSGTMYRDYQLTCLNAETTYYFYLRTKCGENEYSDWSADYGNFTTDWACPAPYINDIHPKHTVADISWYGDPDDEWDFQYKESSSDEWITPADFSALMGAEISLVYRLTGLTPDTEYDIRLRQHCGMYSCPEVDDGYSEWATDYFTTSSGCWGGTPWMCTSHLGTQAALNWRNDAEASRWQIRYRLESEEEYPEGNIVTTELLPEASMQQYTVTGLLPNSTYYWQVRGYCDEESQSDWSDEDYFFTRSTDGYIIVDKAHPYYEDFENGIPEDWSRMNLYNYNLEHYDTWQRIESSSSTWESFPASYCISSCRECMSWASPGSMILMPAIHIDENATSAVLSFWSKDAFNDSDARGTKLIWVNGNYLSTDYTAFDLGCVYQKGSKAGYWRQCFVNLDDYIGQTVIIAFDYVVAHNYNNYDWWVDNVRLQVFDKVGGSGENVTSGDWNNGDFWGGSVPDSNDDVIINANVTIPEGVVAEANQIIINTDTINVGGGRLQKFGKLIIADGGQLKVKNEVEATMQKTINAYTRGGNGWYLIAPPVQEELDPEDVEDVITTESTYDLYKFDGSYEGAEWRNYKQGDNTIIFQNGQGYLYANSLGNTPTFTGTVLPSNQTKTVDLDFAETIFGAWNLVGNPFTCNAYLSGNRSFYRLVETNEGSKIMLATDNVIAPMEGVFVQAADDDDAVTFTTTEPQIGEGMNFSLRKANSHRDSASTSSTTLDCAGIRFGEGQNLGKFGIMASPDKLYIPEEDRHYAVVHAAPVGELPLNFEAADNDSYTINFENETEGLMYCHLIDNLTGNDIDLLQQPEYTFSARKSDYPSRFKVVFVANGTSTGSGTDGQTFAFYSNGNWIIANEGRATMQVVDMTGRILSSEQINGCAETRINAAIGVYVLRLISGENVKAQKVVIK